MRTIRKNQATITGTLPLKIIYFSDSLNIQNPGINILNSFSHKVFLQRTINGCFNPGLVIHIIFISLEF